MKNIVKFSSIIIALCMLLSFTACDTVEPINEPQETKETWSATPLPEELPFVISPIGMIENKVTLPAEQEIKERITMDYTSYGIILDAEDTYLKSPSELNLSDEYREMLIHALETPPYENTLFYLTISVWTDSNSFVYEGKSIAEWREDENVDPGKIDAALEAYENHIDENNIIELISNEVLRLRELGYNVWLSSSESNGYCITGLLSYEQILNFPPSEEYQELIYNMELG